MTTNDNPHEHQWQDSGFADVEDCAVEECQSTRSGGQVRHICDASNDYSFEEYLHTEIRRMHDTRWKRFKIRVGICKWCHRWVRHQPDCLVVNPTGWTKTGQFKYGHDPRHWQRNDERICVRCGILTTDGAPRISDNAYICNDVEQCGLRWHQQEREQRRGR